MSCGPAHLVPLLTELFYMQVGFQLSWIIESGSVAVRCLKSRFSRICHTFLYVLFACTFIHSIIDLLTHL